MGNIRSVARWASRGILFSEDTPEPVAAWREVPEATLRALSAAEKVSYLHVLLPLARDESARRAKLPALRRLYQLFSFLEIGPETRQELVESLFSKLRLELGSLPTFSDRRVGESLVAEALALSERSSRREGDSYVLKLREHFGVPEERVDHWKRLINGMIDAENRVATLWKKRGQVIRSQDRKLEITKRVIAGLGIPTAMIFPAGV